MIMTHFIKVFNIVLHFTSDGWKKRPKGQKKIGGNSKLVVIL